MEISSEDGARLRMRPLGYQSGFVTPEDPAELDDWDDWLVVAVEVATAEGRSWSFSDPCLTVDEALDLARWLRGQASDASAYSDAGEILDGPLLFTEPNLTFRALAENSSRRLLEVDFSYESLPPWLPGSGLGRVYPLRLDVPAVALVRAADRWAQEIAEYPRRVN